MDSLQDYSSDSSDHEDPVEEINTPSLPPIPEEISNKFVKRPRLPDPEFYDLPVYQDNMKSMRLKDYNPNNVRNYARIPFRRSKPIYDLINAHVEEARFLVRLSTKFNKYINFTPLTTTPLGVPQTLHLSLTRNFGLQKDQSSWFVKEMEERLSNFKKKDDKSNIVTFDRFKVLKNFNAGMIYLALCASESSRRNDLNNLHNLVEDIKRQAIEKDPTHEEDEVIDPYDLHVSVAQAEIPFEYENRVDELTDDLEKLFENIEVSREIQFPFSTIDIIRSRDIKSCKIGDY